MQSIFTLMTIFSEKNKHTDFLSFKNAQKEYLNKGCLNPFAPNAPFLYALKKPENL